MGKSERSPVAHQVAALPVHAAADGSLEVLLVTSRDTGRWIIPKGWPMKGISDSEAAATEAFEEAGVSGKIAKRPLGSYRYDKVLSENESLPCKVSVFLLTVEKRHKKWPENDERRRRWLDPDRAARRVIEPELKAIILDLKKKNAA